MATPTAVPTMAQRHQQQQAAQQQQQQQQQPDPFSLSAQAALNIEDSPTVRIVQIAALVVMKIIKQCRDFFPSPSSGHLLGLDVNGVLQITHSYPLPSSQEDLPPGASLETERRRQQAVWIKTLSEVNVDNNMVGWYQSAYLGSFMNGRVVDGLLAAGQNQMLNDKAILIIHDMSRSASGPVSLRAFRLTSNYIAAHKEGKFTAESLARHNLTHRDILEELPLEVYNSHLVTSLLHTIESPKGVTLSPNFDTLDLSVDPYLEKNLEYLIEGMDEWTYEQGNLQYFQRQLGREQTKIAAWQAKRKAENATRIAAKQAPLPEDEWIKLFKLPAEPSRLESLLISGQIDQYCKQIDTYSSSSMMKMFALKGMPVVDQ